MNRLHIIIYNVFNKSIIYDNIFYIMLVWKMGEIQKNLETEKN